MIKTKTYHWKSTWLFYHRFREKSSIWSSIHFLGYFSSSKLVWQDCSFSQGEEICKRYHMWYYDTSYQSFTFFLTPNLFWCHIDFDSISIFHFIFWPSIYLIAHHQVWRLLDYGWIIDILCSLESISNAYLM